MSLKERFTQIRTQYFFPKTISYDKTKFLTGFRAYAALGVILIHSGGAGLRETGFFGTKIVEFGRYGVIVFFVLSAFTIFNSIEHTKNFTYYKYLIRRLFRIVPLYVIMLAIAIFILGYSDLSLARVKDFLISASFFNFFDIAHRNNILHVEWTIPIEVFFYLILPFVFYYLNKKDRTQRLTNLLFVGGITSLLSVKLAIIPYFNSDNIDQTLMYAVERYVFTYTLGISIYYILKNHKEYKTRSISLALLILSLFAYMYVSGDELMNITFIGIFTVGLIYLCYGGNRLGRWLFENRVVQFLGTISYSMYLTHYLILLNLPQINSKPLFFIVLVAGTVVISTVTYYFIEAPFIILGKKLAA